ncbi:MAG: hypothetical protein OHK0047_35070 [Leptolyngbyaceae cyanobacterium]
MSLLLQFITGFPTTVDSGRAGIVSDNTVYIDTIPPRKTAESMENLPINRL